MTSVTSLVSAEPEVNICRLLNTGLGGIEQQHEPGPYDVVCMEADVRIEWSTLAQLRMVLRNYNLAMVGGDCQRVGTTPAQTRYGPHPALSAPRLARRGHTRARRPRPRLAPPSASGSAPYNRCAPVDALSSALGGAPT